MALSEDGRGQSGSSSAEERRKNLLHLLLTVIESPPSMLTLAYIDPGSGLLVWQMIAAAVVGCFFYVKKIRNALYRLVTRPFKKPAQASKADGPTGTSAGA